MLVKIPATFPSHVVNQLTSLLQAQPEAQFVVQFHGIGTGADVHEFSTEVQQELSHRGDLSCRVNFAPVGTAAADLESTGTATVVDCVVLPNGLTQLQHDVLCRLTADAYTREELSDHLGVSETAVRFATRRLNERGVIDATVAATVCEMKEVGNGSLKS